MSQEAIAAAGKTLVDLLRDQVVPRIAGLQDNQVALASPEDAEGTDLRLTLFLYSVVEQVESKNEPQLIVDPRTLRQAPLSLDLHFLLTAYPGKAGEGGALDDLHNNTVEAHRILGRAMQVLYDHGILTGSVLRSPLRPDDKLRLTLYPITVEDLTRIWSVFPNSGYHPSVSYLLTPVRVDSEREPGTSRVLDRRTETDSLEPLRTR